MAVYELAGHRPQIDPSAWVAESAAVIGKVALARWASVWFSAVLRADSESIFVGENSNVQDGAVLHVDSGYPVVIGANVTIGHNCIVHGCTIEDGTLIGMGAIVLDGVKLGKNCLVAAGTLIPQHKEFSDNSLIMGSPAKRVRELSREHLELLHHASSHYVERGKQYRGQLKRLD